MADDDDESDDDEIGNQPHNRRSATHAVQVQQRRSSFMMNENEEYNWADICKDIDEVRDITSRKDQKMKLSEYGFNTLYFPLHPDYIPAVDPTRMQPEDIMHLFLCGITRHELYHLIEHLVKRKTFSWQALNSRISVMRIPKGKRIPKVYPAAKGKKVGERHLDMTASEVLMFAKLRCGNSLVTPHQTSVHTETWVGNVYQCACSQ